VMFGRYTVVVGVPGVEQASAAVSVDAGA